MYLDSFSRFRTNGYRQLRRRSIFVNLFLPPYYCWFLFVSIVVFFNTCSFISSFKPTSMELGLIVRFYSSRFHSIYGQEFREGAPSENLWISIAANANSVFEIMYCIS